MVTYIHTESRCLGVERNASNSHHWDLCFPGHCSFFFCGGNILRFPGASERVAASTCCRGGAQRWVGIGTFPQGWQMKHGEPLRFSGAKPFKFPERSRGATGQKSPWPVKKLGRKPGFLKISQWNLWMCWGPLHGWETYYLRLSSGRDKSYRSILMYLDRLGCTGECSIRHNLTQKVLERGNVILWFFDLRATAAISMGGLFIMPQRLLLGEITPCYCAMVLTLFISRWFQGNLKRMLLVSMFMHSSMLLPRSPIIVSIQISNTSSIPADISGEGGALSSRAPN